MDGLVLGWESGRSCGWNVNSLASLLGIFCWTGKVESAIVPQDDDCQVASVLEPNFCAKKHFPPTGPWRQGHYPEHLEQR